MMNETMKEKLSRLVDNESELSDELYDALKNDKEAWRYWQQLHLTRDILQQENTGLLDSNFSANLSQAIQQEPELIIDNTVIAVDFNSLKTKNGWIKPIIGFALAASVAAISVMTCIPANENSPPELTPESFQIASSADRGTYWKSEHGRMQSSAAVAKLNALLSNHLEVASTRGVGSVLPYSRMVGYDEVSQ